MIFCQLGSNFVLCIVSKLNNKYKLFARIKLLTFKQEVDALSADPLREPLILRGIKTNQYIVLYKRTGKGTNQWACNFN